MSEVRESIKLSVFSALSPDIVGAEQKEYPVRVLPIIKKGFIITMNPLKKAATYSPT